MAEGKLLHYMKTITNRYVFNSLDRKLFICILDALF